jgi:uncharacterized protein (DUF1778 family)
MPAASENKPVRLNIRVSEQQKRVISQAADLLNTTVSNFVLQTAYAQAQAVIREQTQFRLSEAKWRDFCEALDAPAKDIPELRKLLTAKGVFDA